MERNNNNNSGGFEGVHKSKEKGDHGIGKLEIALRVLALLLTLIAAIVLAVNKQTKTVPIQISPDLPAFNVPVTAKSSYQTSFVYFVVANSIACAFAAITLALALASKGGGRGALRSVIIAIDLMMVALLFSSIGATGAVGLLGARGNSHLRWNKVCNVYGKFCNQVTASLAISFVASIAYLLLVLVTVMKLHKRA